MSVIIFLLNTLISNLVHEIYIYIFLPYFYHTPITYITNKVTIKHKNKITKRVKAVIYQFVNHSTAVACFEPNVIVNCQCHLITHRTDL